MGNAFNLPLFIPAIDVQYLYGSANNNLQFQNINIQPVNLTSGQSVALNAIGTQSTANLRYIFPSNLTIGAGATLSVGPNVNVQLSISSTETSVTLTDNGILSFGTNDTVTLYSSSGYGTTAQIVVSGGGDLNANGTTFAGSGTGTNQIVVNTGGQLTANSDAFTLSTVTLNSGSTDTIQFSRFTSELAINSGAAISISQNDLTNIPGSNKGIVASGATGTTINVENNYWSNLTPSQISAKITDYYTNSSLPQVLFQPTLAIKPATTLASPANVPYNASVQNLTLTATVTSPSGTVNEGTETFTILNGSSPVGNPVTVNVSNGVATTTAYSIPGGTAVGTYTIQAAYSGTSNYSGYTDTSQSLIIGAVPVNNAAYNESIAFSSASQSVNLTAAVTSSYGTVNGGTETFTVFNGGVQIGNPVNANVSGGAASASYSLPAGLAGGTYTISAVYSGTVNFAGATDSSHTLTVNAASTTTTTSDVSATYSVASQNLALTASVTSSGGTIGEGSVTFTILKGSTIIGSSVTVSVASGAASATYVLPATSAGGIYTVDAAYNGTDNYAGSSDTSHVLTINSVTTSTASSNVTATFSFSSQTVELGASVSSSVGTVNEGTETFTILNNSTVIGTPVTVSVAGGAASASYTLPADTAPAVYTIQAVYNGTSSYNSSTDSSHTLTVGTNGTVTAASNATATYSVASQTVVLNAQIVSSSGTVDEGTETFTILNGSTVVGNPATGNVVNGAASADYTLPAGTAPATLTIQAVYNGTVNFGGAVDRTHTLTVHSAPAATVSVSLDPNSNTGAPDHPGYTDQSSPTFDVQVNQAGTITIDFDGNSSHDQTLSVSASGTYQFTAPTLADDAYTATADFSAGLSGTAHNSTGYTVDTVPPTVSTFLPTGTLNYSPSQAFVTFSELVDLHSFTPAAIMLTGPDGNISVNQPELVSGSTYSITFPAQTTQGAYTLVIAASVTDFAGSPLGHSASTSFTIALPDLVVTSTSAPSVAAEGTSIPVSWEVVNESPTNPTAATWHDAVYISTRSVLDGSAVQLISIPGPSSPLAPEGQYSRSTSVTIAGNLATGSYYLLFVTDADGGQAVSDSGNNVQAEPITLTAPDLQVSGVTGPATGVAGQSVLISWTDENTGSATATGPWVDNVFVAADAQGHGQTLIGSFTFSGTLNPGASVLLTQQVVLPQTPGTHWFGVTTNATLTVPEGGNSGNDTPIAASSFNITAPPLPDLVVTSIAPPPNGVFSGNTVPLSFTVKNQGAAPTSVSVWYDWVILSQDPNLAQNYQGQLNYYGPGGDAELVSQPVVVGFANPSSLAIGASYEQNVNVSLPLDAQGTWYVYVVPDGTGAHHPFSMPEASRTDKLDRSTAFTITLSPTPELSVSGVQAPSQDFSGKPMKLNWTVSNIGNGPTVAGAWTDAVYMSPNSTLDSNATLLGTFAHQGVLASGGHYTTSQTVTLPVGVSGSFYFLVKTDLNGQVFQNGQTQYNIGATSTAETVNLTPPPILEVTAISLPSTGLAGHAFTFSYTVKNDGGDTPNFTWNDALYLSQNSTFNSGSAISLGQQAHQGILVGGAQYTNTVTLTLPAGLIGPYYLVVQTDSGNVVFELPQYKPSETLVSSSTVQISQSPPDLVVSSAAAPPEAVSGSAILVEWTVTNQSTGDTAVSTWQDSVYIDTGATLDSNAVLLASFAHYGLLNGGGSYSQAQLIVLPINDLGNYNLFVVTNSSSAVYESNTNNNTSEALPIAIVLQATGGGGGGGGGGGSGGGTGGGSNQAQVSDLQPTIVNGPGTAVTGSSISVSWDVSNDGPATTDVNWWNDDVWLSTHTTLASGGTDIYLGTVQHNNALAANDSYGAAGTFTLPVSVPAGNYYVIVAVDRPIAPPGVDTDIELVYETNYANNELAENSTTVVSAGPTPDLGVSNVTPPATATAGQQLPVSWKVTNTGAATGNVTINDAVFLSLDQNLDSEDRFLGSVSYTGNLANGGSYTQNANFALPVGLAGTFYVIVVTNSNHAVYEQDTGNNTVASAQTVLINLPLPADLAAGTVTVPPSALAGQNITVGYQVSNTGGNAVNGSWTDALYLSPTTTWSSSDPLLGTVSESRYLAPGNSYMDSLTAPVPGVTPGGYYVILRTDIYEQINPPTATNNQSASATTVAIDAQPLTLGVPTNSALNQAQSTYYKVVVPAGQTLQVNLTGQEAAAHNELYASFGTMPSRSQYDFRYGQPFAANQQITVPTTQAGAYYILVYGDQVPTPPENYSIEAALVPFSIQTVAPVQIGTGPATLTISGAQYNFGTTFQLRNSSGAVINATRTLLGDAATAYATFDLTGQALGSYDAWAIQSDGTHTQLAAAVTVSAATPNNSVQLGLNLPSDVLVGNTAPITITYANTGNTDLPAPFIELVGQNAQLQVPGQTGYTSSLLQLVGGNPDGPFGTLPPGFQGSIIVSFQPITSGAGVASDFTLETLQDPTEPFDWNAVAANDVPLATSPQQWSTMVNQAAPLLGSTWGAVVSSIDNDTVQLVKNTPPAGDSAALDSLYNFDALLQYAVGVYGSAPPAPVTPSFPVIASEGEVTVYNAHVNGSGNPLPLNPSYPTFVLIPGFGGYQSDLGTLAEAIAADANSYPNGDVNVLIVTWQGATAGPTINGVDVPWMSALHIDTDGTQLGDLLNSLDQQGDIAFGTTTIISQGSGASVGYQAAKIVDGLQNVIALNPASELGGYLPPSLNVWFQISTAYETSSLFDTQRVMAASNQTLPTADVNNPLLLSTFGVPWLTGQIQQGNDSLLGAGYSAGPDNLPAGNNPPPPSDPEGLVVATGEVLQVASHDPNLIIGPGGSGSNDCVGLGVPLPYTIVFTNTSTTSAPAQQIIIDDNIDPPNLDWGTFRLTSFGFGGNTCSIPANSAYYQTTINLMQQDGFDVDFTATIDESTGLAKWIFTTIDPATGQIPTNPNVGLLPPNNNSGDGEGFVTYTILPTQGDPTGTLITAQASIVFDNQSPLLTNEVSNTIDAGTGLTSTVSALPAYENSSHFNVAWAGSEASNASGIRNFTIYTSDNGGPFKAWLTNTTLSSAPFVGQDGHTYGFYSVATDNAGNVQPTPSGAQAATTVDLTPPATTAISFPSAGGSYNASHWTGTIAGSASDATSGVQGEQISILDRATGKYWSGTGFSSSTEVFVPASVASPGATSTTWSLSFPSSDFAADGSYAVHALAGDEAGNTEATGLTATFIYDNPPPVTTDTLSGTSGSSGWYRSTVSVSLSASDAGSGVAATYYTIDSGSQQTYSGSAFTVSGQGTYHITFWSVDKAGNMESAESDSFKIDSVAPSTTDGVSGTQGSNGWFTSASVSVTLSATDATSGIAATYFTIDGGSQQTYTGSAFTVTGDGTHHITFWSVDVAGNMESAESDSIKIDTTKPVTTDSLSGTMGSNGWFTSASVSVTLAASDTTSGVAATYYTIDSGSQQTYTGSAFTVTGDGVRHITFWSVDVAGNTEAAESASFKIDSTNPTTTDSRSGTQGTNGWFVSSSVSITLSATDATSGVAATYYTIDSGSQQTYTGSAFTVTGDGTHHITFWSSDVAGNTESVESDTIKIDTVKPTTTDSAGNSGWYTSSSVSVTLTATDATSGVAATYYTVDGGGQQTYTGSPFIVTGEGSQHIVFWSVDVAGNVETAKSDSFKIDSVPPSTTDSLAGTQGSNGWFTSTSVGVTLSATDATSGVAETYYNLDGAGQQTYTGCPFTVSGEGTHHVVFWSADVAGNSESAHSLIIKIDSVKPVTTDTLSGSQGSNGWFTSTSVSVGLSASDATSGVAVTYYTIDTGSPQSYSGSAFAVSGEGIHHITFWSVDVAGNTEAVESDTVKIDSIPPTTTDSLSGTQGENGGYTSTLVSVTLTASDATSGVAATYYTIDSGSQQTYTGSAFSVTGEGTHDIAFYSVDVAGNTEATESDSFKIISLKPITKDSLAGTKGTNGWFISPSVSVTLTATDDTSGVSATYYTIDGGGQQTYTGSPFTVTGEGTHLITFWSVNLDGNAETPNSDTFKIDSVPPITILPVTPPGSGWFTSPSVSLTLTATDATSGVAATYYTVDGGSQQTYTGSAFSVSGDGTHHITFFSVDVAGNAEAMESDTIKIDSVAPTTLINLSGTVGSHGYFTSNITVTLIPTDGTSGVGSTYYTLDGGARQTYVGPFTISGDAIHSLQYFSVDVAGNQETPQIQTIRIDTTPPVLTLPANQTFDATQLGGALVSYVGATATDNLTTPSLTYSAPSGSVFPLGTTTVQVTATDDAGNQAHGSFQVTVNPVADRLILSNSGQVEAGSLFSVTVSAEDAFGNIDPTVNDRVALNLSGNLVGGKLSGLPIESLQNGVATFTNLSLGTAATYTLVAASTSDLLAGSTILSVVQAPQFKVTLAPATPGQTAAGQAFTVTIAALLGGQPYTSYLGTVTLSSSDPQVAPQTVTFQNTDNGSLTLIVRLKSHGLQTVTVADVSLPSAKATSNAVSVTTSLPPNIDHFTLTGLPSTDVSGVAHTVTITAVNAVGQTFTGYTGTVHVTSSDAKFTPFDIALTKGVGKKTVTLNTPGLQALMASDGSGHTGTESNILVVSPATTLGVTPSATKISAGGQITVTVAGLTAAKTPDSHFADMLLLTTSDPNAKVVTSPISGGMQTFTITFQTAGTQTISVTDLTRPAIKSSAPNITVTAGLATQLSVTGFPLIAVAGAAQQQFTVTAEDAYGNPVTSGFTDTVQVAGQTYSFKAADHGKHVFTTTSKTAGSVSLTATDISNPGVKGTEANITVLSTLVGLANDPDPEDNGEQALIVVAPPGASVVITPANSNGSAVTVSMTVKGKTTTRGPFAPTGHIIVYGQGNNVIDEVANSQGALVAIPAILIASSGNSTLSVAGSSVGNVLVGGTGADVLTGGSGADILIGGGGADSLRAGTGGDVLISGSTTWDSNVAALAGLLKEWSRPDRTYLERVHDLFGDGSGGLNGAYLLDPQTVLRDTAIVQLYGDKNGGDWFWFSEGFRSMDRLSGFAGGEVGTFE